MTDWTAGQARTSRRRVEHWVGVEPALGDTAEGAPPRFGDARIPCPQLAGRQATMADGVLAEAAGRSTWTSSGQDLRVTA